MSEMIQQWAIKTEKLRKDYPGLVAVQELDFGVVAGSVHGFLGPNGAGKSTTLRMICGLLRPSSGRALVHDFDPVTHPLEVKRQVGLLPESTPLYRDMPVAEFLTFTARLRQVPAGMVESAVSRVIEQTGLGDTRHRLVGNLSKGYRQRVGIAQALVHDPKVVILDEPTAGLDPQSVVEIRALIRSLKGDKTVVFSSHILTEVEEVCDTISIIDRGTLKASGSLAEIRQAFQGKTKIRVEIDCALSPGPEEKLRRLGQLEVTGKAFTLVPASTQDVRAEIVRLLTEANVGVLRIDQSAPPLEEIFITLTKTAEER